MRLWRIASGISRRSGLALPSFSQHVLIQSELPPLKNSGSGFFSLRVCSLFFRARKPQAEGSGIPRAQWAPRVPCDCIRPYLVFYVVGNIGSNVGEGFKPSRDYRKAAFPNAATTHKAGGHVSPPLLENELRLNRSINYTTRSIFITTPPGCTLPRVNSGPVTPNQPRPRLLKLRCIS
jgi:hypothetical protein